MVIPNSYGKRTQDKQKTYLLEMVYENKSADRYSVNLP